MGQVVVSDALNTSDKVATDESGASDGVVTDESGVSVTIHEYTTHVVSIDTV